jgi:hypothetical protein
MIFFSLRADITMCGFYAILILFFYSLFAMLAHDLSVIDDVKNELAFRIAVYTAVLISDRMILMMFLLLFFLLSLLRNASFTRRFNVLIYFSAALMKTVITLKVFFILRAIIKLKKFVFNVFSYLSLYFNAVFSLF